MDPWAIVDPVLDRDRRLREVCDRLMCIVRSGWTDLPEIDVGDPDVLRFLMRHRVATLIPLDAVPDVHRDMFAERLRTIYVSQMRIEATAREVGEVLAATGIECRLLKGLASAHLDYPRPEYRHTGDVDIAVPPTDFVRAQSCLAAFGCQRKPDLGAAVVIKGATFTTDRGVEVDLHDRLFVRSRPTGLLFDRLGEPVPSIGPAALQLEERLLNAIGAFILTPVGHRRLSGLVDVTRMLDGNDLDVERLRTVAGVMRVSGLVGATLRLEARLTGRTRLPLDGWPALGLLDRLTRFGPRRRLALEHVVRLRHVPPGARLGYLPTWLRPGAKDRTQLVQGLKTRVRGERAGRD